MTSWLIRRTHSKNLPVYQVTKRGGNLRQTEVKKVEGDVTVLKGQLQKYLNLEPAEVVINPRTQHIVIKGHRQEDVLGFFKEHGF
ncbi:MAG: hypothetical protein M1838_005151 [Thelocarpon superellum]|nr:MAG: hypothetical protein M1838_005151 [Thelocarpon superellum]